MSGFASGRGRKGNLSFVYLKSFTSIHDLVAEPELHKDRKDTTRFSGVEIQLQPTDRASLILTQFRLSARGNGI